MRKSTPVRAASARERRLDRWRTARRAVSVAVAPWAFALFRSRPGSAAYHVFYDIGIGFFVVCIAGVIATRPLDSDGTARPADEQPDPPRSADTREAARPIDSDERARWAEATLRALAAISPTGDDHDGPDIAVLRVGAAGVELLLHAPCPVARFQKTPTNKTANSGAFTKAKTSIMASRMLSNRIAAQAAPKASSMPPTTAH